MTRRELTGMMKSMLRHFNMKSPSGGWPLSYYSYLPDAMSEKQFDSELKKHGLMTKSKLRGKMIVRKK